VEGKTGRRVGGRRRGFVGRSFARRRREEFFRSRATGKRTKPRKLVGGREGGERVPARLVGGAGVTGVRRDLGRRRSGGKGR
jgi:hypothetical protein